MAQCSQHLLIDTGSYKLETKRTSRNTGEEKKLPGKRRLSRM
uniref:Uncharacterized protein n=1 Tax=Arundo donax TaxID=35708 RepID=A0A0A9HE78_ARUDO